MRLRNWFDSHLSALVQGGTRVLLIVALALVLRALVHRAVNRVVRTAVGGAVPSALLTERRRQRTETLGSVLRSIASFGIGFVAGAMVLSELGLDLGPVVASAGIVGVAVGFGAQNLVKDFLSGVFMLLEDQYGVGDVVDAGVATGTVEAVSLRTTKLRDVDGTVWHIRNGEIARIGNKSQGWARALLDVPLDLDTDVAVVRSLALEVAEALTEDPDFADKVVEQPEVWGLESIGPDGLLLRIALKTAPLEQWAVERALRERLINAFDEHGIAIGVPRRTVKNVSE